MLPTPQEPWSKHACGDQFHVGWPVLWDFSGRSTRYVGICPHYNLYFNSLLYFLLWYKLNATTTKRPVNKQFLVPLSEFILKILGLSGVYFHGDVCVHMSVSMHMCENWGAGRATEKRQEDLETLEWEGDRIKVKNKCSLKPCWRVSPESRTSGIFYCLRLTLNCLKFSDS